MRYYSTQTSYLDRHESESIHITPAGQWNMTEDYWRRKCEELERVVEQHDLLPIPPAHLRVRIGGWDDPDHFLGVGRKIYWDLKRVLGGIGRTRESFESILDFGCGCARTLRFFPRRDGLHGCDIDPEAIAWCREHLGERASFQVNS